MTSPVAVPSLMEATSHVEPKRAFEFWRSTALAAFGDIGRQQPREPFSAKRLTVATSGWALTHTVSSPVAVEFTSRHIDRNAPAMVVIGLGIQGIGYQEQYGRGTQSNAGDISFLSRNRPFLAGTQSNYEEIRLAVPRAVFADRVGHIADLAGRSLTDHRATADLRASLQALPASLSGVSEHEAQPAIEGALHLLGCVIGGPAEMHKRDISQAAVEALARAHIIRRLREPDLDPREIQMRLGVSRSSLYRAFAASGGIAAAIRDARLDLAHRWLTQKDHKPRVSTIAYTCGFTDVPTFNRGFRKRFGLSPRDLRASCA